MDRTTDRTAGTAGTAGTAPGEELRSKSESTVSTIAEQAQQTAEAHVSTQKDQAAQALHSVASAVRDSGQRLRSEQPQLASLAEQAAQKVDEASDYIRQHDVRDFVRTAEDFARREPLLFLGGAFAIGFLTARFLKASSPSTSGGGGTTGDAGRWSPGRGQMLRGTGPDYGYQAGYGETYRERSVGTAYGGNESDLGTTRSGTRTTGS
ncbi:MAG: hypothetical protein M3N29_08480 [Chloroflexota bacterium]|nr:hypothetical protein [Chloroflexota bacterium]